MNQEKLNNVFAILTFPITFLAYFLDQKYAGQARSGGRRPRGGGGMRGPRSGRLRREERALHAYHDGELSGLRRWIFEQRL